MMTQPIRRPTVKPPHEARDDTADRPRVELIDEPLLTESEVRRAVLAGAITSGFVGAIFGAAFGYLLGLRDGKEEA